MLASPAWPGQIAPGLDKVFKPEIFDEHSSVMVSALASVLNPL
jgi:hypothetical protein